MLGMGSVCGNSDWTLLGDFNVVRRPNVREVRRV